LTDDATRHWTGKKQSLTSMIRIDTQVYRLMGDEPKDVPPLPQVNLQVLPTRSIYDFEGASVHVKLTFMTPALPDDLEVLSRPLTYLTWEVRALDGKEHDASIYFSASAELTVNEPSQKVVWSRSHLASPMQQRVDLQVLKIGSAEQPVLQKKGDDLRIDWGYLYAAVPIRKGTITTHGSFTQCSKAFVETGYLPLQEDTRQPRAARDELPVSAFIIYLGKLNEPKSAHILLAYDDEYSLIYFGRKMRPFWGRNGAKAADLLQQAEKDYETLKRRCEAFDNELMADLTKVGGAEYAQIAALAYRQCLAANKLVADANGQPLIFPKENFSNGCIATVDVIYPMSPLFLLFSPTLAKASVMPVLDYAASPRWKFPFAPHDLGTYPIANGQVYGGGEKTEVDQMPVEESGNMLMLLAAIAYSDMYAAAGRLAPDAPDGPRARKVDYFLKPFMPQLTKWAEYLAVKGFDPENQLCTDDFAGHLAHNVNLSAKAIEGLYAYAFLEEYFGDKKNKEKNGVPAAESSKVADLAQKWMKAADDGDHYRLAFDRPGTWSQKYNLVWDRILQFPYASSKTGALPPEVARKEIEFYLKKQNRYGLPLDNRKAYTKLDWIVWTATMAESQKDFEALISPVYRFLNETTDRVPMTDWYWTDKPRKEGFQARSVVGGVFMKMLADKEMWKKWASRDKYPAGNWAPLPAPPQIKPVVPDARQQPVTWRFTTEKPSHDWYKSDFDAANWKGGRAGFGSKGTPGAIIGTEWRTADLWLRRDFDLPESKFEDLQFQVYHDEDVEIYVNGLLAASARGYVTDYELMPIGSAAKNSLKPGKNVLAVHCHQTTGGQYIDVGLAEVIEQEPAK
jgi:hypothetical protein